MEWVFAWLVLAALVGAVAGNRGRSGFGWFLLCTLISPLLGLLLVLALDDKRRPASTDAVSPGTHVRCPECRELVRHDAIKCKHCGCKLVPQAAPYGPVSGFEHQIKALGILAVIVLPVAGVIYLNSGSTKSSNPAPIAPAAPAYDSMKGIRTACQMFIQRQQLETRNIDWGDYFSWTVVDNRDGTHSVGARYAVGDKTRYTTCVLRLAGSDWQLVKLTRLQ